MTDEREKVISDIVKEVETINNISVIRFILSVVKSYKKNCNAA